MQAVVRRVGLPLELLQLESGALGGDLLACAVGPLRLLRLRMDRRLHSWGPKPPGHLTIALNLDGRPATDPWRSHGRTLPTHCLFGLDSSREVHLILPQAVTMGLLLIPREVLRQWAERLGWLNFEGGEALLESNWLPIDQQRWDGLSCYLRQIFAQLRRDPISLQHPQAQRLILEDLMPLLVEALVTGLGERSRLERPPARIELVKEVQHWIHAHPGAPTTLADLCDRAHISRRTLIQGFQDHLGMGPMAYLKINRLHGVRRVLLAADSQRARIGSIAAEWGFLNAGHFARDYRLLFGERPFDTLQASPRGAPAMGALNP
jgi:AraC family ethanolamine operon transcriptional activator